MHPTDITHLNGQLLDQIMFGHKEGDWLVLDDTTLRAALDKTQALTRNEWNALMASPLTLRRLRHLVQERKSTMLQTPAANDDHWSGSQGLLLAAGSNAEIPPPIATSDEALTLLFHRGATDIRMVLKLDLDASFARGLLEHQTELVVTDGAGNVLMQGVMDENGELEAAWPFPGVTPYAYLKSTGGTFNVAPR